MLISESSETESGSVPVQAQDCPMTVLQTRVVNLRSVSNRMHNGASLRAFYFDLYRHQTVDEVEVAQE